MKFKMPPKKVTATTNASATPAVASTPQKRGSSAVGRKSISRTRATSPATSESSSSDEDSDPDDDVLEEDLLTANGQHVLDFECVRDASRSRVAPKTRSQYDQFVGMMAVFALSRDEFKCLVIVKQNLSTFQPPLPIHFVSEYLNHVERKRVPWPGKAEKVKPVSPAYYKAVVLSTRDLYICEQTIMSDEMTLFLNSRRQKFQRDVQEMRAVGTYPSASQRYITSEGYCHLAKTVVQANPCDLGGWAVQAFAALWGYVVLLWCLMARCDRVARLRWADFGWYKDALTAYICKSKCDQAGVNAFHKKLYFNDACAETCPITAVAVLFFSREEESQRSDFVFPRSDTRRMGSRYLSQIIASKYTSVHSSIFGCNPLGISWHHFKRGAFTFLAGLTDACSYVATKMRADQKVADVSRVYSFFGQGQDGVVGRLLSMLPYGEQEFVGCAPELSLGHASISWVDVVPDWDTLDDNFKLIVVPRLFAVLVHRLDWLKQHLPADHPLWHSKAATSGKLIQFIPNVRLEQRPLASLTGVSLEMKNALRLAALAQTTTTHPSPAHGVCSLPSPLLSKAPQVPPSEREDLGLRLLTPLPINQRVVPHLTCQQAWRAFFITTDSLPYPLRYAEGKLTIGRDVTALSRIKTVMNAVSKGIAPRDILQYPEATFQCGFANLQQSLYAVEPDTRIFPYNTCGTIEAKLRAAKRRGWSASDAVFCPGIVSVRPIVYDAVDVHDAQVRSAEARQQQASAVCQQCRGLCMHCMHCDACAFRIDGAAAAAAAAAAEKKRLAAAAAAAASGKKGKKEVRCLQCMRVYCDKSSYNRHLRLYSSTVCCKKPLFEHVK